VKKISNKLTKEDVIFLEKNYYVLPKGIIDNDELPGNEYKLFIKLYQLTKYSIQNKWIDPDGTIYVHYTQETAGNYLKCTKKTAGKCFALLEEKGYIETLQPVTHKVKKIYVLKDNLFGI
jgi:hypothetical protein